MYGGITYNSTSYVFDGVYNNYIDALAEINLYYSGRYVFVQYCNTAFDYPTRVTLEGTLLPEEWIASNIGPNWHEGDPLPADWTQEGKELPGGEWDDWDKIYYRINYTRDIKNTNGYAHSRDRAVYRVGWDSTLKSNVYSEIALLNNAMDIDVTTIVDDVANKIKFKVDQTTETLYLWGNVSDGLD